jgi:hypothetical protein
MSQLKFMHVGLDMSLVSPGIAICTFSNYSAVQQQYKYLNMRHFLKKRKRNETYVNNTDINNSSPPSTVKWSFMAFSQRRSDIFCTAQDDRISIKPKQKCDDHDIARYVYITDTIISYINTQRSIHNISIENINIFIEGYAFKATGSGSSFKLHELGGVLRYALYKNGILPPSIRTIYSTQWKAYNVGVKASKFDTMCHIKPILDVQTVFGTFTTCSEKKVFNPHQDISDAIGITLASLFIDCT